MRKRGQSSSQVFIYIIAVLVIGLIVLFGYQSVSSAREKGEQALLLQFEAKLKEDIDSYSSYGSLGIKEYQFPSGFDEICFVDLNNFDPETFDGYRVIEDSVRSKAEQNVFLLGDKVETFYIENLQLYYDPYYSCVEGGEKIKLKIEGQGDVAILYLPYKKHCQNAHDNSECESFLDWLNPGYSAACCEEYNLCCI